MADFKIIRIIVNLFWFLTGQVNFFYGQETNYFEQFGKKNTEAINWLLQNPQFSDSLLKYNIEPAFAFAIVYPEIIRFNHIKNCMEVTSLKTLYVQYGAKYADFSIGRFQMKPTFAKALEIDCKKMSGLVNYALLDTSETTIARKNRILRLDTERGQIMYLIMFIKIMDELTIAKIWASHEEKIRYYATAYNRGYYSGDENIRKKTYAHDFYTGTIRFLNSTKYCYSDIANFFYLWYIENAK